MSEIATAPASAISDAILTELAEWEQVSAWLEQGKAREMELRTKITSTFFPEPTEGSNKIKLPDGRVITMVHKINRNLDEAALDHVMQQLPVGSPFRNVGVLIGYKPVLITKGLRALPEDQLLIFSQALIEKPGAPALTVGADAIQTPPPDWPATKHASDQAIDEETEAAPVAGKGSKRMESKLNATLGKPVTAKPATKKKALKK